MIAKQSKIDTITKHPIIRWWLNVECRHRLLGRALLHNKKAQVTTFFFFLDTCSIFSILWMRSVCCFVITVDRICAESFTVLQILSLSFKIGNIVLHALSFTFFQPLYLFKHHHICVEINDLSFRLDRLRSKQRYFSFGRFFFFTEKTFKDINELEREVCFTTAALTPRLRHKRDY